jgi:hypothetical protein
LFIFYNAEIINCEIKIVIYDNIRVFFLNFTQDSSELPLNKYCTVHYCT